jgi:Leucine-rich repeat (LRR) protein
MCIICETNDISTLVNLTYLDCSYCCLITSIPNTLINLTYLSCYRCHPITSIPDTLVSLTYLN